MREPSVYNSGCEISLMWLHWTQNTGIICLPRQLWSTIQRIGYLTQFSYRTAHQTDYLVPVVAGRPYRRVAPLSVNYQHSRSLPSWQPARCQLVMRRSLTSVCLSLLELMTMMLSDISAAQQCGSGQLAGTVDNQDYKQIENIHHRSKLGCLPTSRIHNYGILIITNAKIT